MVKTLVQRIKSKNPTWAYIMQIAAFIVAMSPFVTASSLHVPAWFTWAGCAAAALLQLTKKPQVQSTDTQTSNTQDNVSGQ